VLQKARKAGSAAFAVVSTHSSYKEG
jgi:hypothetical protein